MILCMKKLTSRREKSEAQGARKPGRPTKRNLDGPCTEKEPDRQTVSVQTLNLDCQLISFRFRSLFHA